MFNYIIKTELKWKKFNLEKNKKVSFTYHSDGHVLFKWAVRLQAVETASSPTLSTCKLEWEQSSSVSSFVSGLFQICTNEALIFDYNIVWHCVTLMDVSVWGFTNSNWRIKSAMKCLETSGMGWKRHRNQICVWWRGYMNCGQEMFTNS